MVIHAAEECRFCAVLMSAVSSFHHCGARTTNSQCLVGWSSKPSEPIREREITEPQVTELSGQAWGVGPDQVLHKMSLFWKKNTFCFKMNHMSPLSLCVV